MNAIIGICHFCEAHGPRPVFCTFTTDNENHTTETSTATAQCTGCTSLGPELVLVTKDNGTFYCSRESLTNSELTAFLRHAAIRSITCEVSWSKEGGVVYFSDTRGHVLSSTFQLKDTRARGLKRWFSLVVLMKDKMMLLALTPTLTRHMQEISNELQQLCEKVYDAEQKVCSQRALRLNTGTNYFGQSRSLRQLTGHDDIFEELHVHFTRMLKAGSMTYSETLYTTEDLFKNINHVEKGISIFTPNICKVQESMSIRKLEIILSKSVFKIVMYCTLVGVSIYINEYNNEEECLEIIKVLMCLLPVTNKDNITNIRINDGNQYPSNDTLILERVNDHYAYKWLGVVPNKFPTLMCKIENAMHNTKYNDDVLHQHIKSLQLEWLGIARTVKSAVDASGAKSESIVKLKQVLGVTPQDETLVQSWIKMFCT